ncbi:MAG: ABC transporter permease subunit [Rhodobacteraceae bacterium]|nr:ABC transporter permease subunit [Paracoccaceae bacterium]
MGLLSFGPSGWGDELLTGLGSTLAVSACAYVVALLLGSLIAWAKLSGPKPVVLVATVYTTVMRAVPELLLIILFFYAGSSLMDAALQFVTGNPTAEMPGFIIAVSVLALIQGAFASEVVRGAILSVPTGMAEAAFSFGYSKFAFRLRILLPLFLPIALPGLMNTWLILLKESALISVIGYSELMTEAKQAAASTKEYFLFFGAAAVLYYIVTLCSTALGTVLELYLTKHRSPKGDM